MRLQIINKGKRLFYYSNELPNDMRDVTVNARPEWHTKEERLYSKGFVKQDRRLMTQMGKLTEIN